MEVVMIERNKLVPLAENLRKMTDEDMMLLEKSISDLGVVEPLHVVEYEGGKYYLIVNGNHRFQVLSKKFNSDRFPCVVIGRDFPIERVYVEAIRLNSISGEFDMVAVVEKVGKIVKKWVSEGRTKRDIASMLGIRESSPISRALLGRETKSDKKTDVAIRFSKIESEILKETVMPVTFWGRICIIKDEECVSLIREIMLSSDFEEFGSGLERLREVLRKGVDEVERRG